MLLNDRDHHLGFAIWRGAGTQGEPRLQLTCFVFDRERNFSAAAVSEPVMTAVGSITSLGFTRV